MKVRRRPTAFRAATARRGAGPLVLGIDGGGSKTLAVLADAGGRRLAAGEAGCSNHHVVGWAGAQAALDQAIRHALVAGHIRLGRGRPPTPPIEALCIGTAGVDSPDDAARLGVWLRRQAVARRIVTVNDGELLLAAGTTDGVGVGLIAGTGSISFGRNVAGLSVRAGGWGHLVGDEGSGYDLGMQALRLVLKTLDGRAQATAFARSVMRRLGVTSAQQLLAFIYHPGRSKAEFAALAPVVFRLAARGDRDAQRLLAGATADLAQLVTAVAARLSMRRPALVLGGSLLVRQSRLRAALVARLGNRIARVEVVPQPALGAVKVACGLLD